MFVISEEDLQIKTYIRQEDGSVDAQQPSFKLTPMQEKCDMYRCLFVCEIKGNEGDSNMPGSSSPTPLETGAGDWK